jgi:hypothetical protein
MNLPTSLAFLTSFASLARITRYTSRVSRTPYGKSRVPGKEVVLAALGRSGEKTDFPNSLLEDKRNSKRNMQDSLGS